MRVPGDKSISHRAIMLASIAQGTTTISGLLDSDDSSATLVAMQQMGVNVQRLGATKLVIEGVGISGLRAPKEAINVGNSGTTIRLLAGLLSGQNFDTHLYGDESLNRRPMRRIAAPIALMGGQIETSKEGTAPILVRGGKRLEGIEYRLPVASAQLKSALLLAGLYARGETAIMEPFPTRDHTERMLQHFGYQLSQVDNRVSLVGGAELKAADIAIPADISAAAFFIVAATICAGSELRLKRVGINSTRIGLFNILKSMGADIRVLKRYQIGGEPAADIKVCSAALRGIRIPIDQVSIAIDELPVIFIAAACAQGKTLLTHATELRHKESDRIAVVAEGLQRLGINAQETADGISIEGGTISGGTVDSYGDHRVAMSFVIAAVAAKGPVNIHQCEQIATSFPNFAVLCRQIGIDIEESKEAVTDTPPVTRK